MYLNPQKSREARAEMMALDVSPAAVSSHSQEHAHSPALSDPRGPQSVAGRDAVTGQPLHRRYAEGFDDNGRWEASLGNLALELSGVIVDIGQVPGWMRRQLEALTRSGALVRYRGFWNTLSPAFGLGSPKTIWALPHIASAAGVA